MSTNLRIIEAEAKRLVAGKLAQGFLFEALHTYTDSEGNPLFWRVRLKHPRTGEKIIWPIHQDSDGNFILKEPAFCGKKPLYNLYQITQNHLDPVWIAEGEWCVDKLTQLGVLATTSGGSNSAAFADWSSLKSRQIILWPDNDEPGLKYAKDVAEQLELIGCSIQQIDIQKLGLPIKGDCVDWLNAHSNANLSNLNALTKTETQTKGGNPLQNHAQHGSSKPSWLLLELIKNAELFHDEHGQGYITFNYKGKLETFTLLSSAFKNWLSQQYWERQQKPVSESNLQEAISILSSKAQYEGKRYKLFNRVGYFDQAIYLNLANEQKQVIEITATGWKVLNHSPVKFKQHSNMKTLPLPQKEGELDLLWKYLNVAVEDRKLVLAWILDCWIPYTHFPIMVLTGLQGSAKSTTQDILRKIIDPNICNLRNTPRHSDDIPIAAANNWLVSYNNISKLSQQYQDDFCCLSTGGGFARRKLFSNIEETSVNIKRPVILNGIVNPVTSQDLISRSLIIELPCIDDHHRKLESELRHSFKQDHPKIFGALLNLLTEALQEMPNTQLEEKPRMSDFARLGTTLEKIFGWLAGSFLKAHKDNYQNSMIAEAEDSAVSIAIMKLMQRQNQFKGTFGELFELLSTPYYKSESALWPSSPKGLANILKREVIALESANIKVFFNSNRTRNGYLVSITQKLS